MHTEEFNRRIREANKELKGLGVSTRELEEPKIFRVLRYFGLNIKNTYYMDKKNIFIIYFIIMEVAFYAALSIKYGKDDLIWKLTLTTILAAFYAYIVARRYDIMKGKLTKWEEL